MIKGVLPCILIIVCCLRLVPANFLEGEFVPTARRAQFHGVRTSWHDLLGRHCPRFGQDRVVAVPLPHPKGQRPSDDYKVSFAFDHDRLVTHWLRVIGKHAPGAPLVDIELTQRADVLVSAKAKVLPVPPFYLQEHSQLIEEFQNSTHWPKHLLVRYHWAHNSALNINAAICVLFGVGILASAVLALNVVVSYQQKLADFLVDLASESGQPAEFVNKVE
ncbi:hypothetical protein ABBQ38_009029 [Trebouxia sp. C0009 RCD-2024]